MGKQAVVLGAGFSGLAVASLLQRQGWQVTLWEKNPEIGGRARLWSQGGYHFDMGPSWYLMPEVFERFFALFGKVPESYYGLTKLQNQYKVFFEGLPSVTVTDDLKATKELFESFERGGAAKLEQFLAEAKLKYDTAMSGFLYKDYRHLGDFLNWTVLTKGPGLGLTGSLDKFVAKRFNDRRSRQILEYAMVFLGSSPANAPALYSLLSHVDLNLGVWFPRGGMNGVAQGLARLFVEAGGTLVTQKEAVGLTVRNGRVERVKSADGEEKPVDLVVNTADYAWSETTLLQPQWQTYPVAYWNQRVLAPSMFLAFLGVRKCLPDLEHHNLYFSADWNQHFKSIFETPAWPQNPCFYLSAITKTDPAMAPAGAENLFLLIPAASGLPDDDEFRSDYLDKALRHVEAVTQTSFRDSIEVQRVFSQRDFQADYHAWKGTGLGLAHTLFQTAIFRPARRSRKVGNLFYTGQYTHPGVGVPMTLISAQVTAQVIERNLKP